MKYLMAIDAGTGSIRAVIFDTKGNQISMAQKEWTHLEEVGVQNSMSFDFPNFEYPLNFHRLQPSQVQGRVRHTLWSDYLASVEQHSTSFEKETLDLLHFH